MIHLVMIFVGIFYAAFLEWLLHIVLHRYGTKKGHVLSFHFQHHHRNTRKNEFKDPLYDATHLLPDVRDKEFQSLLVLSIPHWFLMPFVPGFVFGAAIGGLRYYYMHRKSHLDVEWCKQKLPWHYEHHMAPNQHANWGVTTDFFDRIFGTRERYLGTDRQHKLLGYRSRKKATTVQSRQDLHARL